MGSNASSLKPKQAKILPFQPTLQGVIAHAAVHSIGERHPDAGQPAVMTGKWEFRGNEVDDSQEIQLAAGNFGSLSIGHIVGASRKAENLRGTEEMLDGDRVEVVLKRLAPHSDKSNWRLLSQEIQVMQKVDHANLLRMYGIRTVEGDKGIMLEILFEHHAHGVLKTYLDAAREGRGTLPSSMRKLAWAAEAAAGLAHLASHGVVLMDFGARTCLLDGELALRVGDYGLTRTAFKECYEILPGAPSELKFPVRWMAPEWLADFTAVSHATDVWAFGVFLYEISTCGGGLYPGMKASKVARHVIDGGPLVGSELAGSEDPAMISARKKCLVHSAVQRPSLATIAEALAKAAAAGICDEQEVANRQQTVAPSAEVYFAGGRVLQIDDSLYAAPQALSSELTPSASADYVYQESEPPDSGDYDVPNDLVTHDTNAPKHDMYGHDDSNTQGDMYDVPDGTKTSANVREMNQMDSSDNYEVPQPASAAIDANKDGMYASSAVSDISYDMPNQISQEDTYEQPGVGTRRPPDAKNVLVPADAYEVPSALMTGSAESRPQEPAKDGTYAVFDDAPKLPGAPGGIFGMPQPGDAVKKATLPGAPGGIFGMPQPGDAVKKATLPGAPGGIFGMPQPGDAVKKATLPGAPGGIFGMPQPGEAEASSEMYEAPRPLDKGYKVATATPNTASPVHQADDVAPSEIESALAHLYNDNASSAETSRDVEYHLSNGQQGVYEEQDGGHGCNDLQTAAPAEDLVPFKPDTEDEYFVNKKKDGKDEAQLKQFCKKGWYQKVAMILRRQGVRINATRKGGSRRTPLHEAADAGFLRIVRMLLGAGANPHKRDASGKTPYDLAKAHNYANVTVILQKAMHGLDTGTVDDNLLWCAPVDEEKETKPSTDTK